MLLNYCSCCYPVAIVNRVAVYLFVQAYHDPMKVAQALLDIQQAKEEAPAYIPMYIN